MYLDDLKEKFGLKDDELSKIIGGIENPVDGGNPPEPGTRRSREPAS